MGIGFIFAGIALILAIIIGIEGKSITMSIVGVAVAVGIFGVISGMSAFIYHCVAATEWQERNSTEIYSIGLNTIIEGSFMLGCGSVDSEFVYTYYLQDEDKSFELKYIKAAETVIKETNAIKPCIKKYIKHHKSSNAVAWMFSYGHNCGLSEDTYVIYIPEGSIVQTYNITP